MPTPTYNYTAINANQVDGDSPLDPAVWETYRRNQIHQKEFYVGTGRYEGRTPHRHLGVEDASIGSVFSQNLLSDGCPHGSAPFWTKSGWAIDNTNGFDTTTTAGHYAFQILYGQAAQSKAAFGAAGGNLVISLFVKSQGSAPTAGELWFGLADGLTSAYLASCKGVIDGAAGAITTSWKRFYMTLAAKGGGATTDVRVLLRNGATPPNQKVFVTAVAANLGSTLTLWEPSPNEDCDRHDDWDRLSVAAPIYETATALTNAVSIAGA